MTPAAGPAVAVAAPLRAGAARCSTGPLLLNMPGHAVNPRHGDGSGVGFNTGTGHGNGHSEGYGDGRGSGFGSGDGHGHSHSEGSGYGHGGAHGHSSWPLNGGAGHGS